MRDSEQNGPQKTQTPNNWWRGRAHARRSVASSHVQNDRENISSAGIKINNSPLLTKAYKRHALNVGGPQEQQQQR